MRRCALLLVTAGCSGVFGLDETAPADSDGDHDGVAEIEDNCPGLANADQLDTDGDEVGDACDPTPDGLACASGVATGEDVDRDLVDDGCDPCLSGPPHDEDEDGIADACDNCPGTPNPAQVDMKETGSPDGLGDDCDVGTGIQQRVVFDPFVGSLKNGVWEATSWSVGDDLVTSAAGALRLANIQGTLITDADATWSVATRFEFNPIPNEVIGIGLEGVLGSIVCGVRYNGTSYELVAIDTDNTTVVAPVPVMPGAIRVWAQTSPSASVTCSHASGTGVKLVFPAGISVPLRPTLRANIPTRFFHAEVIR